MEDILCEHSCGAVLGRREPHPERPAPASAGSGMACEACTIRERLRPAVELLRQRKATPARVEGWGPAEIDHLEEHHARLPDLPLDASMDERCRVSGLSRAIRMAQQAIDGREQHKAWRHLRRLWSTPG